MAFNAKDRYINFFINRVGFNHLPNMFVRGPTVFVGHQMNKMTIVFKTDGDQPFYCTMVFIAPFKFGGGDIDGKDGTMIWTENVHFRIKSITLHDA